MPTLRSLSEVATAKRMDLPAMLSELSGVAKHDALRFVRRSPIFRLGLIGFEAYRSGAIGINIKWTLEKLLDCTPSHGDAFIDTLIGPRQTSPLTIADFAEVSDAPFMADLIAGAVREKAKGINILIYGPPGTGKTEFARVLCSQAKLRLHAVGEVDEDGDEPTRDDRVSALMLAQKVLEDKKEAVVLFDEMEDFIGDTQRSCNDLQT